MNKSFSTQCQGLISTQIPQPYHSNYGMQPNIEHSAHREQTVLQDKELVHVDMHSICNSQYYITVLLLLLSRNTALQIVSVLMIGQLT